MSQRKNLETAVRLGAPDPEAFRQELAKALNEAGHVVATRASQAPQGPQEPTGGHGAGEGAAEGGEGRTEAHMRPEDVPDSALTDALVAYHCGGEHLSDFDPEIVNGMRDALAAVIPAIRAAALTQAAAELTKTRDGITWNDDIADSARAAYSDAINRLDRIGRGGA